jgi:hypothetical protein
MSNQENYKSKYLKYKTKYLNLLSQSGGFCEPGKPEVDGVCKFKEEVDKIIKELPNHKCEWGNCIQLNRLNEIKDKIMNNPNLKNDIKNYFINTITKIEGTQNSCKICTLKKEVDGIISVISPLGNDSADCKVYNTNINRINQIKKELNPEPKGEVDKYFTEKLEYAQQKKKLCSWI